MSALLYFDLVSTQESLIDREGVEISDVRHAKAAALATLQELRQEDASAAQDWSGWTLNATDSVGHVLFSIDLALLGEAGGRAQKIDRTEAWPGREKLARRGRFPSLGGEQTRPRNLPIAGRKRRKS
jgi:Domain of unknown function (DUF6894)